MDPYDNIGTWMSDDDIAYMVDLNPYRRYWRPFFVKLETSEHRHFNNVFSTGHIRGKGQAIEKMISLLKDKGMEKEEIKAIVNQILGEKAINSQKP
jgi:hypothetical protein